MRYLFFYLKSIYVMTEMLRRPLICNGLNAVIRTTYFLTQLINQCMVCTQISASVLPRCCERDAVLPMKHLREVYYICAYFILCMVQK